MIEANFRVDIRVSLDVMRIDGSADCVEVPLQRIYCLRRIFGPHFAKCVLKARSATGRNGT